MDIKKNSSSLFSSDCFRRTMWKKQVLKHPSLPVLFVQKKFVLIISIEKYRIQYQSLQLFLHSCWYAVIFCDYIRSASEDIAAFCFFHVQPHQRSRSKTAFCIDHTMDRVEEEILSDC